MVKNMNKLIGVEGFHKLINNNLNYNRHTDKKI